MAAGAASWTFTEDDFQAITGSLQRFLYESNARCALLVDRAGQLVATVGEPPAFDPTAFASLTAADFSANDQLARLIGESDFTTLFHQGERESMYLADAVTRIARGTPARVAGCLTPSPAGRRAPARSSRRRRTPGPRRPAGRGRSA